MTELVPVGSADDLLLNSATRIEVSGQAIALVRDSAGEVHAIGDTCTHGDISLSEGFVEDDTLECWAHGSKFSLTTGAALTLPAFEPVPVFRIEIREGEIWLDPTPRYDHAKEEA